MVNFPKNVEMIFIWYYNKQGFKKFTNNFKKKKGKSTNERKNDNYDCR